MGFLNRRVRVAGVAVLLLAVAGLLFFMSGAARAASQFTYAITLTYQLDDKGSTKVVSQYSVTNNTPDRILASLTINAPTNDVREVKASYSDGTPITTTLTEKTNTTLGYNYQYKEINLAFDRWPGGRGAVQDFTISYQTDELVDIKGTSKTFYVPSLAQIGEDENYTVSVAAPASYGKMFSTGALPEINGADGNRIRYTFPKSTDLKRSVSLIFGESTVYSADFNFPLNNTSANEQVMTITLPPDTSSQKIFVKKLDPVPVATRLDPDGNILADYKVPARTKLTVHTDIAAQIKYLEYDLSKSGNKQDIPADLAKNYTAQTRFWQTTDPALQVKAKQAVAGKTKVIDQVKALYGLTIDTLSYNNEKIKYNIRQGSTKALQAPDNAVCLEYADVLVALLRSEGIPARMPVGYAYAGNLKQSKSVVDSLHSWVEAYVPGIGWMNVDPTWGEKFDNFGQSDLDHFSFAVWGRDDASPAAVMAGSQDMNYQYEDTKVTYSSDFPRTVVTGHARAHKYVLFPGISILQYEVTAPENVAGDNYSATIGQYGARHSIALGSLAPMQVARGWLSSIGAASIKPAELTFAQTTNDRPTVLAATTSDVIYWPMFVVIGFICGILLLIALKLFIHRRQAKDLTNKEARDKMRRLMASQHDARLQHAEADYVEGHKQAESNAQPNEKKPKEPHDSASPPTK